MIFFPIYLMQMVSLSLCFDAAMDGTVHFSKDLLRRFDDDVFPLELNALEGPPSDHLVQLIKADLLNSFNRKKMAINDIGDKDAPSPELFEMEGNTHEMVAKNGTSRITFDKDGEFRSILKHELSHKGSLRLKILAYYFKDNLSSYGDITTILKNATDDFLAEMNAYYFFISKKSMKYAIDKEFVVLDMIENTNKILLNAAKMLLNDIIEDAKANKAHIDFPYFMEKIKSTVLQEKQDQLRYVCRTLDVCRSFPGFCDLTADLLSELLLLNDHSFQVIVKSYEETMTVKRVFFKTITNDNVYALVSSKLNGWLHDIDFVKEVLSMLRAVITQRYIIFKTSSLVVQAKTKAVRILLDLIDKAFEVNDDELNYIEIQNVISSYKKWAAGERNDVDVITKKFVYNAIEVLNYSWSKHSKEEVKVLTDVIFAGKTNNMAVYDYLFKNGSIFINDGEIQHADVA